MNKQIQERDAALKAAETKLRDTVQEIREILRKKNGAVFNDKDAAGIEATRTTTQSQVFQLLQDRLTETGTHCGGVYRY